PGIRPGKRTADHLDEVLTKITWVGGLYLAIIALIPEIMLAGLRLNHLPGVLGAGWFDAHMPYWLLHGLGVNFYFGGTSLLSVIDQGQLVTDDVVCSIVEARVQAPDCRDGFILDGFPRTLRQAKFLDHLLEADGRWCPLVLNIRVDRELLIKRAAGRRTCSIC